MRRNLIFQVLSFDSRAIILKQSSFASFVSKVTIEVGKTFSECLPRTVTLHNQ